MSRADQVRTLTEEAFWSKVHRSRRDNPHEVTADQVGATGGGGGDLEEVENRLLAVEAHVVDKDNPHEVTAEQVGAGSGGGGGEVLPLRYHPLGHSADITTISGLMGEMKWAGGVLGPDGKIYGIPSDGANTILIVDPAAGTADTTMISGLSDDDYTSWAGGVLGPDGKIYGIPSDSESVLLISPGIPTMPIEPLLSPYLNKF